MNVLEVIGRDEELFDTDIENFSEELNDTVAKSKFLSYRRRRFNRSGSHPRNF